MPAAQHVVHLRCSNNQIASLYFLGPGICRQEAPTFPHQWNERDVDASHPDILIWGSGFFIKDPGDGAYISWHQDATYWGLEPPEITTAWIALTPSTAESGCLQVAPGTHKMDQLPHDDSFAEGNLLSRGASRSHREDRPDEVG